jgi:hypothetical protein
MVQSVEIRDGNDGVPTFPGPLTLIPSRKESWRLLKTGGFFTILGILVSFDVGISFGDRIVRVLATAFFGVGTVMGVIDLLPGSSSLRLDENGFEITHCFRKQQFRWNAVSDFDVWTFKGHRFVIFKAAKSRLGLLEKLNAAWTGGRNGSLPTRYGMAADDLVQLMTTWRNSALNATKQAGS